MKFRYWKLPSYKTTIPMPIIEVVLSPPSGGETFRYPCLVDSGAEYCYFHAKGIGRDLLKLVIEDGEAMDIKGIAGISLEGYLHKIHYKLGGWDFEAEVCFVPELKAPFGILGRAGFFDFFKVQFEHRKEIIELKDYQGKKKQ